jgi:diaminohydroxyphosphoribosylaminopyrimidine deaminase/5-amino-6-(5-phosphoribosylamino)uracil reductase
MFACLPPSALPGISPSRGEITVWPMPQPRIDLSSSAAASFGLSVIDWPISPLEGEMPGRAEGGIASVTSEVTHGR